MQLTAGCSIRSIPASFFERVTGEAVEVFARLDHRDGMFLKGIGVGDLAGGCFYDEDFPPGLVPYSNTLSSQRDGRMQYGSLDAGHLVLAGPGGDLGGYVGYRDLDERENASGFLQLPIRSLRLQRPSWGSLKPRPTAASPWGSTQGSISPSGGSSKWMPRCRPTCACGIPTITGSEPTSTPGPSQVSAGERSSRRF